jgi:hypothetical protein
MHSFQAFPKGGYMKSLLSILFGGLLVFGLSYLPNSTLAQTEPPVEMPADPMMPDEEETPPPDVMPGDDEEAPPTGEGEDIPADDAPPIQPDEVPAPDKE